MSPRYPRQIGLLHHVGWSNTAHIFCLFLMPFMAHLADSYRTRSYWSSRRSVLHLDFQRGDLIVYLDGIQGR